MQTPKRRKAIPATEAWLYRNKAVLKLVRKGLAEARKRQFSKSPPDVDADVQLASQMKDLR